MRVQLLEEVQTMPTTNAIHTDIVGLSVQIPSSILRVDEFWATRENSASVGPNVNDGNKQCLQSTTGAGAIRYKRS